VSRTRRWGLAVGGAALFVLATALPTERLRHLAIPVVRNPSRPSTATARTIKDAPPLPTRLELRLPARISAILPRPDGVLFIGTFDEGLWRFDAARDRVPVEVGELHGRERFVDALCEHRGQIVAGTHRGALLLDGTGQRQGVVAAGEAVQALAVADGRLILGTTHGLWVDGAPLGERGPEGEVLRVTALAVGPKRLYIGTADGAYSLARPVHREIARWHPLVFGDSPSQTNVVTALAPFGDDVLAGTDDGGLVLVENAVAMPFTDARANVINAGAMAARGTSIFVGTEGGGLLRIDPDMAITRPTHFPSTRISAIASSGRLYIGTDTGDVFSVAAAPSS
jgi:ligand-binding sensor domain-containing protein